MKLYLYYRAQDGISATATVTGIHFPSIGDVLFTPQHGLGQVTHTGGHFDENGTHDGFTVLLTHIPEQKEST